MGISDRRGHVCDASIYSEEEGKRNPKLLLPHTMICVVLRVALPAPRLGSAWD